MEFDFEGGFNETVRRIDEVVLRPILVTVYGLPDSGKSSLINRLTDNYRAKGWEVFHGAGAPSQRLFERIKEGIIVCDLYLFHFGIPGDRREFDEEDPDYMARQFLGRKVDLNIGIYNPARNTGIEGNYDVVIRNPDSKIDPNKVK